MNWIQKYCRPIWIFRNSKQQLIKVVRVCVNSRQNCRLQISPRWRDENTHWTLHRTLIIAMMKYLMKSISFFCVGCAIRIEPLVPGIKNALSKPINRLYNLLWLWVLCGCCRRQSLFDSGRLDFFIFAQNSALHSTLVVQRYK